MTVLELIEALKNFKPDTEVVVYNRRDERREPKPKLSPLGGTVVLTPGRPS